MKYLLITIFSCSSLFGFAQSLPDFSFENAMAFPKVVDQSLLPADTAIIVIYFDTDNQESIDQATEISQNMNDIKDVYFIFVCKNRRIDVLTFRSLNFKAEYNVLFCIDSDDKFKEWFGFDEVPTLICYDKSWNRGQVLSSFQTAETLALGVQ